MSEPTSAVMSSIARTARNWLGVDMNARRTRSLMRRARDETRLSTYTGAAGQSQCLPRHRLTRCAASSKLQLATSPRRFRRCRAST